MTLLRSRAAQAISRVRGLAVDAMFPPKCVGCGSYGAFICDGCAEAAPRATGARCARCWLATRGDKCQDCERQTPAFAGLRSAMSYGGVARDAVLALKFEGVSAVAPPMAACMAQTLKHWSPPVDAIVPVPLGWLRRRTRGYNQSELLAAEIARAAGLPVERQAIRRRRQTSAQARQRDAESRRTNMLDAFAPGARPVHGSVLVIDDVATTGATLDAAARALLAVGASEVYALTFARED